MAILLRAEVATGYDALFDGGGRELEFRVDEGHPSRWMTAAILLSL
jgi:hypothetical protein